MGPASPRPYHARREAPEEVPLLVVAVMPEVKLMAVMMVAEMPAAGMTAAVAATMATMPAAG